MTPFQGELLGTALLLLFGCGTVANVVLADTKGRGSGWIVITTGWAMGVFVGALSVARISGAHLNPAVTLAMALTGKTPWSDVPAYFTAQVLGAMIGALGAWAVYLPHWSATENRADKLGVFATIPAIRRPVANMLSETVATFALMMGIFGIKEAVMEPASGAAVPLDMGALGVVPVAFLIWGIGLALGGTTGYAINPARDLGPRIMHALLPIPGKGSSDWAYAWVPVVGPMLGGALAAGAYTALGKF